MAGGPETAKKTMLLGGNVPPALQHKTSDGKKKCFLCRPRIRCEIVRARGSSQVIVFFLECFHSDLQVGGKGNGVSRGSRFFSSLLFSRKINSGCLRPPFPTTPLKTSAIPWPQKPELASSPGLTPRSHSIFFLSPTLSSFLVSQTTALSVVPVVQNPSKAFHFRGIWTFWGKLNILLFRLQTKIFLLVQWETLHSPPPSSHEQNKDHTLYTTHCSLSP